VTAPQPSRTGKTVAVLVALLVVLSLFSYRNSQRKPIVREVTGRITRIDAAARSAEIVAVHPKTGETMPAISGHVPENCEIRIDNSPARIDDLRPGDAVAVQGRIDPDRSITANWIRVTRGGESSAAPASAPVSGRS